MEVGIANAIGDLYIAKCYGPSPKSNWNRKEVFLFVRGVFYVKRNTTTARILNICRTTVPPLQLPSTIHDSVLLSSFPIRPTMLKERY